MTTLLVAVDGTERGLQTVSILGGLLRERSDLHIVLLHCVQQVATLLPGDLCEDIEKTCRMPSEAQEKIGNAVIGESLRRLSAAGFPKENVEVRLKFESMDPAQDIIDQAVRERIRNRRGEAG